MLRTNIPEQAAIRQVLHLQRLNALELKILSREGRVV